MNVRVKPRCKGQIKPCELTLVPHARHLLSGNLVWSELQAGSLWTGRQYTIERVPVLSLSIEEVGKRHKNVSTCSAHVLHACDRVIMLHKTLQQVHTLIIEPP